MATSGCDQFRYDVFLSFRGIDTRTNFTDHLYRALKNAGVETFRDDDEIRRCESIKSEIQIAIKQSKMSLIVFSRDYTSSKACLQEVKTILQHSKKSKNHDILPVFYHVEPEELKKKARDLAALQEDEEWSEALREVASIAGMPLKDQQYESVFIDEIVQIVQGKLMPRVLPVRDHLVGMKSRVKKIESWLRPDKKGNESVGMLVICGMGGLGKTTTATAVFNSTHGWFEGSSFLSNIREASKTTKDLLSLQRKFLSDIQRKPEKKIDDRQDGHRRIRFVLANKRILLVLDDVDEEEQLEEIIGMRNWFMPGSKIIVTSRREDLLKGHEDYEVHRIEKLDDDESLELFSIHAFGKTRPVKGFEEHSKRFVDHCQGLPLALEVLGSAFSRMSLKVRNDALTSLGIIPKTKVLDKLKISFDSLSNKKDKDLFLDVACFFVGSDKNDTISILDGCGYYAAHGIEDLVHRNLLTVGENNKLGMHQLIQDMGRQVVSDETTRLEKRTRLWLHEESYSILRKKIGSENVQGLILDMKMIKKKNTSATNINPRPTSLLYWIYPTQTDQENEILLETESLKGMINLRLLKLNHAKLCGSYAGFPQDLRLLCLRGFHMKSLPNGFPLDYIVSLDLRNSSITQVFWKENMVLATLKILNLSHCHQLAKTPNLSIVPKLEKLILKDCPCLYEIHESIAKLEGIILLNLKDCKNLRKLPKNMSLVKSLEQLTISGCSNLVGVAEELAKMDFLKGLFADRMTINQILFCVPCEAAPRYLFWLTQTKPVLKTPETSCVCLPRTLVTLSLIDSNITDDAFPEDFGNLHMLESLNLTGNLISKLPDFIRKLGRLKKLNLSFCRMLEDIEWPKIEVNELVVTDCRALQRIMRETTEVSPRSISHGNCWSLNFVEGGFKIELMENVDASVLENIGFCDFEINKNIELLIYNAIVWSSKKLPVQVIYEKNIFSTYFHGNEVPGCFTNKSIFSNVLSFIVPTTSSPKIRGLNMCLVYTLPTEDKWLKDPISITISNKTKGD